MSTKTKIIRILNLILLISFVAIFISLILSFELNLFEKIILFAGFLFLYLFFIILSDRYGCSPPHKIIIENKTNLPKKKYLGSNQTGTYHLNSCRFSKLIKPEYKIEDDNKEYFKKMNFYPCKICKPNLK